MPARRSRGHSCGVDSAEEVNHAARDPAWVRLDDELAWYDAKSVGAQHAYKRVKLAQIVAAAAVAVLATLDVSNAWIAALGALLVVLEGVQQLYQWQTNWVLYRSTAEALKHERFLYLSHAGPYATRNRRRVLAERVEGLVSQEHAKWTQGREQGDDESDSALRSPVVGGGLR